MIRRPLILACIVASLFWTGSASAEITFLNAIQQFFRSPTGVDVGPDGEVFVSDQGNNRIQLMDPTGRTVRNFSAAAPRDVAVSPALTANPNGTTFRPLYVVERDDNRIRQFTDAGFSPLTFGTFGSEDGQFDRPLGVGVDLSGDIFVADTNNNRIQRFDDEGEFQSSFGVLGSETGQFNAPSDVAIGPLGDIFVADRNNNRVQKFDNDGNFEFAIGGFDDPTSLATSAAGLLYVVDRDNHRVLRFGTDGFFQASFGSFGNDDDEFDTPLGVGVSLTGLVYVADSNNGRVPRYFDSDAWVYGENEFTNAAAGPTNVAVGSDVLFAAENFDRVSLGRAFKLDKIAENKLKSLIVGNNTRIAEDGTLILAGGSLSTSTLQVDTGGEFIFNGGSLEIRNQGLELGGSGPFGDTLVVGLDSSIVAGGELVVGLAADSRLTLVAGGTFSNAAARVAPTVNSTSSVVVEGFGSSWNNSASLVVGEAGNGGVSVTDGGRVSSQSGSLGKVATGEGSVVVAGLDSRWTTAGSLAVGEAGSGRISIVAGGRLSSDSASLGLAATAEGTVVVSGLGSRWVNTGVQQIGEAGTGGLSVRDGGRVTSGSAAIGLNESGEGNVEIAGFDSRWIVAEELTLGGSGSGRLLIDAAGTVQSGDAVVGSQVGLGLASIAGAGSRWDVTGSLTVGSGTAPRLGRSGISIGPGGTVAVTERLILRDFADLDVAGSLRVSGNVTLNGVVTIRNGSLQSGPLTILQQSLVNVESGDLTIDGAVTNAGEMNFTGNAHTEISATEFSNSGLVRGGARLSAVLENDTSGELRLGPGEEMIGTGSASRNVNRGRIGLNDAALELAGFFENTTSGLVDGRGVLRADAGNTNRGNMIFSGGQTDVQGTFLNTGSEALVLVTGGGTTTFFDDVTSEASSEIRVSEGSHVVFLGSYNGGTTGPGTAVVEGILTPGNSPARVDFGGDLIIAPQATTILELGGTIPGVEYDQIVGAATIELDGAAQLQMIDDYAGPRRGEVAEFTFVSTQGDRVGFFDSLTYNGVPLAQPTENGSVQSHVDDGLFRTVTYSEQALIFAEYLAIPGDADGDGRVQFGDFLVLSDNFGGQGTWTEGDFDNNGVVQFPDFLQLSENFGRSLASQPAAVPEPSSVALLLFAIGPCLLHCRHSRKAIA